MRILVADDQTEIRSGLKILLEHEADMQIIGEASGIGDLLFLTQKLQPDIILLDWELDNIKVADFVPVLRSKCPEVKIIAMSGRPEAMKQSAKAGTDGFISKGNQPEKLLETIFNICSIKR